MCILKAPLYCNVSIQTFRKDSVRTMESYQDFLPDKTDRGHYAFFYIIILLLVLHFYSHIEYEICGVKDYYIVPFKDFNCFTDGPLMASIPQSLKMGTYDHENYAITTHITTSNPACI